MKVVICSIAFFLAFASTDSWVSIHAQSLTANEILAKHLDSIGTKEKREFLKTLFAAGVSEFTSTAPAVKGGGKAVVVSDPGNLFFVMSLNSREYPFEKVGAFKNKVSLPFINAGTRSLLGSFLNEHPSILLDSLFCGSMSLRWITDVADKKLKMKAAGMKKIDGKQTYAIEVLSSEQGSDDFKVRLYFDAQNFRHIRSEYRRDIKIGRIVFGQQNQIADAKLALTEEFSDFKEVDGLTFPHMYKLNFTSNSNSQMYENSWGIRVGAYYINQKLTDDFFSFDVKD
jgi:hypothetical protein